MKSRSTGQFGCHPDAVEALFVYHTRQQAQTRNHGTRHAFLLPKQDQDHPCGLRNPTGYTQPTLSVKTTMSHINSEIVGACLVQAAGLGDSIVAVLQIDDDAWTIEFEDGPICLVEWNTESAQLALSADLGVPPDERQREVQSAALSYNALWRQTGGMRVAQAGDSGELILFQELDEETTHGDALVTALDHFGSISQWWNAYVTLEFDGAADAAGSGTTTTVNARI